MKRLIKELIKIIRKEAPAADPAARDAAVHGEREFAKIFWKKYTENRGNPMNASPLGFAAAFGSRGSR